jgi:hypothetical protein
MYVQRRDQTESVARELTPRHQINAAAFARDITGGAAARPRRHGTDTVTGQTIPIDSNRYFD